MKTRFIGLLIILSSIFLIVLTSLEKTASMEPVEAYLVYLNGEKLGYISSKDELLNMIDSEQGEIKEQYKVDKVYPPSGLDVEKVYTFDSKISDVNDIYEEIKSKEPFTIEGYAVTIIYTEDKVINDEGVTEAGEPVTLYMLDKTIINEALYNTATAFIDRNDLVSYEEQTQEEITDTGSILTSVYFQETIVIKQSLISTEEYIFNGVDDLSKYLLYGTLETQNTYRVKEGDNLETIANDHLLNIEELMIANPEFPSKNVLLAVGDEVNVGLIKPLVSVVYRKTIVQDIETNFKTETKYDETKYIDYSTVETEGEKGLTRTTQDVLYINGEVQDLEISSRTVLKEPINKVVVKGKKEYYTGGGSYTYINTGNNTWSWPTVSPYVITSYFAYRWGSLHKGIDISGTGSNSPIFAIGDGIVTQAGWHSSMGLYIVINHGNGIYSQYMHMSKLLVSPGQIVSREDRIGLMGSTGNSTGIHLHLGIWSGGEPYKGGTVLNPCKSVFSC